MRVWIPWPVLVGFLVGTAVPAASAAVTLQAPASVGAGAPFTAAWSGDGNPRDFITLVPVGTKEGTYAAYKYATQERVELRAPDEPGDYELRYLGLDAPYPTLARVPMTVTPVTATLVVPGSVEAGSMIPVAWTGPDHPQDFITIVESGTAEKTYATYVYTARGNPLDLRAPDTAGSYEVRYLSGQKYYTLATAPVTVGATGATVLVPDRVTAGAVFEVAWTGPDNPGDYLGIFPSGPGEARYVSYVYTSKGSPAPLRAPDDPGSFEVRYLTGQTETVLATAVFDVGSTEASVTALPEVRGGEPFSFTWTGPDNAGDFVGLTAPGTGEGGPYVAYAYTNRGNPGTMTAPLNPGDYELRYETGQSGRILTRIPIRVTPPASLTGTVLVAASESGFADGAVELILDASGSMLQKQGGRRRIDIAKTVILSLAGHDIPAGTPFALRVFGHKEKDSCRTDLEIPLRPLDVADVTAVVGGIQAMNLAKTPIGRSLELVVEDLAGATGNRAVVLITDGEETCGGDPPAAIEDLRNAGLDARVNIVGFAVESDALKGAFRYWADLGGGRFYDAGDAEALGAALSAALRTPFDVFDANGSRIVEGLVGGPAVALPAGEYTLRTRARPAFETLVTVRGNEETRVTVSP